VKKIYFASDFHLGLPRFEKSVIRERLIVKWLDSIKNDAEEIYLLGDIFDFWHEWKRVVPAGFTRFLGKIAEITDSGIPVHFFTGNHDIWTYHYLEQELGVKVYREPVEKVILGKKFYLAHGDGLGPYDRYFKFLKKIFNGNFFQWIFAKFHPDFAIYIAHNWSHSRDGEKKNPVFKGEEEWLILHSREILKTKEFDYFVYGHRHIPLKYQLNDKTHYVCLGDWIKNFTYAEFDGNELNVLKFQ
jgi:UDP-2,3-diacylglucosamine hydrolase